MKLFLIPLMGPFHLRFPLYNAVSVKDIVRDVQPDAVATTALESGAFDILNWQDTPEIPLPLSVVPWAGRSGKEVYGVLEPSPDSDAEADFQRYLSQYEKTRGTVAQLGALLRPLNALLQEGLTLQRIREEVVPIVREQGEVKEEAFGDGPGTDWLRERVGVMAARILALPHERVAVLASIDHVPFLEDALRDEAELTLPSESEPTEEVRTRSLLDFAFRGDVPEPGNVIAQLRSVELAEARFHEANLLLANGHTAEALNLLEAASRGDFSEPYYLPGYLLSRLGQLRDLAGERGGALRAYRGVRALAWAPREALDAAEAGLAAPFEGFQEKV